LSRDERVSLLQKMQGQPAYKIEQWKINPPKKFFMSEEKVSMDLNLRIVIAHSTKIRVICGVERGGKIIFAGSSKECRKVLWKNFVQIRNDFEKFKKQKWNLQELLKIWGYPEDLIKAIDQCMPYGVNLDIGGSPVWVNNCNVSANSERISIGFGIAQYLYRRYGLLIVAPYYVDRFPIKNIGANYNEKYGYSDLRIQDHIFLPLPNKSARIQGKVEKTFLAKIKKETENSLWMEEFHMDGVYVKFDKITIRR